MIFITWFNKIKIIKAKLSVMNKNIFKYFHFDRKSTKKTLAKLKKKL